MSYLQNSNLRSPNLIINPHGSIQQETTTPITTSAYFADQWAGTLVASGAAYQVGVTTASVSNFDLSNLFIKTTTAKASLASNDLSSIYQFIEGNYARRLQYGTGNAKGSWIRWRASSSQSGTASIAIRNSGATRSFVQAFNVTTTPTDYALFVPGDTAGTWTSDNTASAVVSFCHAAGSGRQTSTVATWLAGDFTAANSQSNMLDTVNRQLNVTDVQWTATDQLIPFMPIDYKLELDRCLRYWQRLYSVGSGSGFANGTLTAASTGFVWVPFSVMRASATVNITGTVVLTHTAGNLNFSASSASDRFVQFGFSGGTSGTAGQAAYMNSTSTVTIDLTARM